MEEFESRFSGFSFDGEGVILDPNGQRLCLFGMLDFERFWSAFDAFSPAPLGRKLLYAVADAEELILLNGGFDTGSWLKRRKLKRSLAERNLGMGWGLMGGGAVRFPAHDVVSVGVALAQHEHVSKQRWKVNWAQQHSDFIALEFIPQDRAIPPARAVRPPNWGTVDIGPTSSTSVPFDADVRDNGFFFGQQRSFFLPVSVFHRLYTELNGRPLNVEASDEASIELNLDENALLFRCVVLAAKRMFEQGEFPVFVLQADDWMGVLGQRISRFGLGAVEVLSSKMDGDFSTSFRIHSPLPGITTGLVFAMWERCFGQRGHTTVMIGDHSVEVTVAKPTLEY